MIVMIMIEWMRTESHRLDYEPLGVNTHLPFLCMNQLDVLTQESFQFSMFVFWFEWLLDLGKISDGQHSCQVGTDVVTILFHVDKNLIH